MQNVVKTWTNLANPVSKTAQKWDFGIWRWSENGVLRSGGSDLRRSSGGRISGGSRGGGPKGGPKGGLQEGGPQRGSSGGGSQDEGGF